MNDLTSKNKAIAIELYTRVSFCSKIQMFARENPRDPKEQERSRVLVMHQTRGPALMGCTHRCFSLERKEAANIRV